MADPSDTDDAQRPDDGTASEADDRVEADTPGTAATAIGADEVADDHLVDGAPAPALQGLRLIGIGGSAGSIPALQAFFDHMPVDTGMAFVVILHLSPEHESSLAQTLQHCTRMRVRQVTDAERIEPNTVYVIPPRKALRTLDGLITVSELPRRGYRHVAVDMFFRALADSHGPRATAIILSGGGDDGAIGIKRIKERGGLTIAQEPTDAPHHGMPQAAIDTGMIDWVLPVVQMPAKLLEYHQLEGRLELPPEQGPEPTQILSQTSTPGEAALRDILVFLRARTGRDFTHYKRATILRRIRRRMQVNGVHELHAYLDCLRTLPGEAGALLQDLLISVTNFFRDAECFDAVEVNVARLFAAKATGSAVRAWVPACATGEEAYSIAIMLADHARRMDEPPVIQVFATDLDERAIRVARDGLYPTAIEADVSDERLRRHFQKEHHGYRVRREIRETVLFAVHDLLKDSPFSRLDLVSCRNLLIYLSGDAQQRAFETLHFALNPGGLLLLGSSESVEDGSQLFSVVDKKHRLYAKRGTPPRFSPMSPTADTRGSLAAPTVVGAAFLQASLPSLRRMPEVEGRALSWAELHFKVLEYLAPPSILIDEESEILHLSPGAARFLQFSGGEPSRNLLRVIHPSLRIELRAALYQALQSGSPSAVRGLAVEIAGETIIVGMTVRPMNDIAEGVALITIESAPSRDSQARTEMLQPVEADPAAHRLERELERLKGHLRTTVEQYEASTEELKASNEELQAMNEELRSATEELETSREELQSINEELTTVNLELKNKVDELARSNSDIHNLMDATAIGTVFLDRELNITRYTPSAVALFNLIPSDVGRPLSDLTGQLDHPHLRDDAHRVLERLVPVEREVEDLRTGRSYLTRALPYRTSDDRIAGVVLTFIDITDLKQAREDLRRSEERFSIMVAQAAVGVLQADLEGRISFANQALCRLVERNENELKHSMHLALVAPDDRAASGAAWQRLLQDREPYSIELRVSRPDGSLRWVLMNANLLSDQQGQPRSAILVITDISERRAASAALRASEERMRMVVENAVEYAIFSIDLQRRVTTWNAGAQRLLGYSEADLLGRPVDVIFTEEDRASGVPELEAETARLTGHAADDREHRRKDGSRFWASGAMMPMRDSQDNVIGFVKILRDQTAARRSREELERSRSDLLRALQEKEDARLALESADAAKDRFLAVLSHELRNPLASISSAVGAFDPSHGDDADRRRATEIIRRQANVMRVLLDELLDVSRLRLGRLTLQRRRVTIGSVIDSAVEASRPAVLSSGQNFTAFASDAAAEFDVDPIRMAQVLTNLLTNAAKYTPDGGDIELTVSIDADEVVFVVSDNGAGMPPDKVDSMFDMFTQGEGEPVSRSDRVAGMGLGLGIGLALVRSIVELHGGSVSAASEGVGRGSQFVVRVPRWADAAPLAPAPAPRPALRIVDHPVCVLVADDNRDAVWGLARFLEMAGHRVLRADGGKAALATARAERPDVVLLDLGMPDLDGYEAARQIRAEPWGASILLIAVSGWGRDDDQRRSAEAGFDAHLVKPVDLEELNTIIGQHIESRRA